MAHASARGAQRPAQNFRPYAIGLGLFAVVAAGTVVFANRGGDEPTPAPSGAPASGATPTAAATPPQPVGCGYDTATPGVRDLSAVLAGRPFRGAADASVTVVEVFDPNCPHCKDMQPLVDGVAERHADDVRVFQVPYPLWDRSFGQVAALYLAQEQGRYSELVHEMLERQIPAGMTLDQVVVAAEAAGMNGFNLRTMLTNEAAMQPLLERIGADRTAIAAALGTDGRMSVPKLVVDGRLVAPTLESYTDACLDELIAGAAAARAAAPATGAETGAATTPAPAATPAPAVTPAPAPAAVQPPAPAPVNE